MLVTAFLPAFRAAQPNRALAEDVRRERSYRPDARVVACVDPARVERDVLFEARVTVERRCDLWNVAPSNEPFLFLLRPEERESLERIPGFREVTHYRYLPAATLTLSGFLEPREPRLVVLGANFATGDPVAEARRKKLRKQEFRQEYEGQGMGQPTAPDTGQSRRRRHPRRRVVETVERAAPEDPRLTRARTVLHSSTPERSRPHRGKGGPRARAPRRRFAVAP